MLSSREIERADRNGRYNSPPRKDNISSFRDSNDQDSDTNCIQRLSSTSQVNHGYEVAVVRAATTVATSVEGSSNSSSGKRHRKHGKRSSSKKKKKKSREDKSIGVDTSNVGNSLPKVQSQLSSNKKPLVEYSDVSSEDLSGPEAGEIQSEDSRGGNNSFTDGELPDSLLQRTRYYGSGVIAESATTGALDTSPISLSPTPPIQQQSASASGRKKSSHYATSPPGAIVSMPDYDESTGRRVSSKRKEKKHKRDKKKKNRNASLSPGGSSTVKKKKRKNKRASRSLSPNVIDTGNELLHSNLASWRLKHPGPSPPIMALKDSTSPISPATPPERRSPSDMDLESPPRQLTPPPAQHPIMLQHQQASRHVESPHTPLLPPRATTPDNHHHTKSKSHRSPDSRHKSHLSPSHVSMSSRRRMPHSPSPPSRRREHSPPRRREYSPSSHTSSMHRLRHSPSPSIRRREFSPSPHRRSRADDMLLRSPQSKRRRRDESMRRHRHHEKDRRDKRRDSSRYVTFCIFYFRVSLYGFFTLLVESILVVHSFLIIFQAAL